MARVNMMLSDETEKKLRLIMVEFNFKNFNDAIDNLCRHYVDYDYPFDDNKVFKEIEKEENEKK